MRKQEIFKEKGEKKSSELNNQTKAGKRKQKENKREPKKKRGK